MSDRTHIQWTDASWNPIRAGLAYDTKGMAAGSLAGHVHLWPTALGMTKACHCGLDAFDYIATLEARLEAAERVVVLARLYVTAPKSRLKDALADYDAALTRPATAAEQEAGE